MKYPKLSKIDYKGFDVGNLKGGINTYHDGQIGISDCCNVVWSRDRLVNRPAIRSDAKKVFFSYTDKSITNTRMNFTGVEIEYAGLVRQLAYISESDEQSHLYYRFFMVNPNGNFIPCGVVEFNRTSSREFNYPKTVTVFLGQKTKGVGVYAFFPVWMQAETDVNKKYDLRIYELGDDYSSWIKLNENDMYVPHYYTDGRGAFYSESGLVLPEPRFVNSPNMLNGSYYCTYTTDDESDVYHLPHQDYDYTTDDTVKIELTVFYDKVLTWIVDDDPDGYSGEVDYNGEKVKVQLIRKKGIIKFINLTPPYLAGVPNNLKITVKKNNPENISKISSMLNGGHFSVGDLGNVPCLFGSSFFPSSVIIGANNNPLYFPESQDYSVGDITGKITALKTQGKNLVIFKGKEIHYLSNANGKTTIYQLHTSIGCNLPKTIALCDNRLVWANTDNKIYVLAGFNQTTGANIYSISQKILAKLEQKSLLNAVAVSYEDRYLLFWDNEVWALDYSRCTLSNSKSASDNAGWFYWTLPEKMEVLACGLHQENVFLLVKMRKEQICYVALMDKNSLIDNYPTLENGTIFEEQLPISSFIKTDIFTADTPNIKEFRELLIFATLEQNLLLDFINDKGDTLKSVNINIIDGNSLAPHRIMPFVRGRGIGFVMKTSGPISLRGITCKYRQLNS